MTLGLTSSGAVKTKSDGALGLRAVECACCAVAQCLSFPVSETLKAIIESATQISINGISPEQNDLVVAAWNGSYFSYYSGDHPLPEPQVNILIQYSNGILFGVYEDLATDESLGFLPEPVMPQECSPGDDTGITTINVNGNDIRSFWAFADAVDLTITFS